MHHIATNFYNKYTLTILDRADWGYAAELVLCLNLAIDRETLRYLLLSFVAKKIKTTDVLNEKQFFIQEP